MSKDKKKHLGDRVVTEYGSGVITRMFNVASYKRPILEVHLDNGITVVVPSMKARKLDD